MRLSAIAKHKTPTGNGRGFFVLVFYLKGRKPRPSGRLAGEELLDGPVALFLVARDAGDGEIAWSFSLLPQVQLSTLSKFWDPSYLR